jgi:hypothetical protein
MLSSYFESVIQKSTVRNFRSSPSCIGPLKKRERHRSLLNLQRLCGGHHPGSWEKMSQIIEIVRQINDIAKREISVVHARSSLPEPERARFWHEQFMPLAAQEHALRQELRIVGQEPPAGSSVQ